MSKVNEIQMISFSLSLWQNLHNIRKCILYSKLNLTNSGNEITLT